MQLISLGPLQNVLDTIKLGYQSIFGQLLETGNDRNLKPGRIYHLAMMLNHGVVNTLFKYFHIQVNSQPDSSLNRT